MSTHDQYAEQDASDRRDDEAWRRAERDAADRRADAIAPRFAATKTIVGYLYRDEYYCPACIVEQVDPGTTQDERDAPEEWLTICATQWMFPHQDRSRPHLFSHHDFPHTITDDMLEPPRPACDSCVTELR